MGRVNNSNTARFTSMILAPASALKFYRTRLVRKLVRSRASLPSKFLELFLGPKLLNPFFSYATPMVWLSSSPFYSSGD